MRRNSFRKFLLCVSVSMFALAMLAPGLLKAQSPQSVQAVDHYVQLNLVSNGYIKARIVDHNLVNPWGIANGPTTPIWIANQGTSTSTLYTINNILEGKGSPFVVQIPTSGSGMQGPTGIVFNPDQANGAFQIEGPNGPVPSIYVFDNLNGTISGWNPQSNGGRTNAVIAVSTSGAMYKGLALGMLGGKWYLYAADATPSGGIKVFDSAFNAVTGSPLAANAFIDQDLPALPTSADAVWTTFNVENIDGNIFVTYAPIPEGGGHPIFTSNAGVVAEFKPDGTFMRNVIVSGWHAGPLSDPWALEMAPKGFGVFGNDLLVGNFGSGEILAYMPTKSGMFKFQGVMDGTDNKPIKDGRLWDLSFGNGADGANPDTLYIATGGPNPMKDGLFAAITPAPAPVK